jgi:rubredoxin
MKRYHCSICDFMYDPEKGDVKQGVGKGTPFEKLPEGWTCPECGAGKSWFKKEKPILKSKYQQ